MIRGARQGQWVVRLKGGDPFVLGRGGEEALALSAAHVPFEVIPGVTSAVAAPALAGIPVTHRGLATGFVVVSGHAESTFGPIVDAITPHSLTLVVLMGLASRKKLAARLSNRGWRCDTPAAVVLAAGAAASRTWCGPLDQLGTAVFDTADGAPGTIVIGDVVGLRARIAGTESTGRIVQATELGQSALQPVRGPTS